MDDRTESPEKADAAQIQPPVGEATAESGSPREAARRPFGRLLRRLDWRIAGVVLLAAIAVPVWLAARAHARSAPASVPAEAAAVAVAKVSREDLYNEVTFYAEFRAYLEVELHAKVSGYVQEIKVDFGDRVKAGQLLARLEVPELTNELDRASAALKRAEAQYWVAHTNYTRLVEVSQEYTNYTNLVAQQDLDTAQGKDRMTQAAIAGAKAEVDRYQTMVGYTAITAPFDGVITHRYVDPGTLVQAGTTSDTQALPVVRLSDNYRLRLDFPVSLAFVKDIREGNPVDVRVQSLGGKRLKGIIKRFTRRVNEDTRKMTTEIEVPNANLELTPGMYAKVVLRVDRRSQALAIPMEAVPAGETNSVYVVDGKGEIEDRPVTLGVDTPTRYEVVAGLQEGEMVLVGPRSQLTPGQKVRTDRTGPLAQRSPSAARSMRQQSRKPTDKP